LSLAAEVMGVAGSGVERANRFVVLLLGLQRLSYLAPALLSLRSHAFASGTLNLVLLAGTLAWNINLFWRVRRGRWFTPGLVWTDVAWAGVLVLVVTANSGADYDHSSVNWSGRIAQATAALAGAAIDRIAVAALAVGVVLAAHTIATVQAAAGEPELAGYLFSCLNGLLWFAVIIGFVVRYLRRQGSSLDLLAEERVAAQADQARASARLAHYRALHDTVLGTLAAIARGGLDHRSAQVRERCARDADYVRRLMLLDEPAEPGSVGDRLGTVVTDAEALGLRVHYRVDEVPSEVPEEVADALGGATQEALNNVMRHSGSDTAWVTVTGDDEAVVVRVVDRGTGFVPDAEPVPALVGGGFGLPWSVGHRMRSVGGAVRVSSAPGDGTCVELSWPAR
jgi:signal transduction histidine kinase